LIFNPLYHYTTF